MPEPTPSRRPAAIHLWTSEEGNRKTQYWRNFTNGVLLQSLILVALLLLPLWIIEPLPVGAPPGTDSGPLVYEVFVPPPPGEPTGTPEAESSAATTTRPTGPTVAIPDAKLSLKDLKVRQTTGDFAPDSAALVPLGEPSGLGPILAGPWHAVAGPPGPPRPPVPVRVGGKVRPPRLLERVEPSYPELAARARIQGDVLLEAVLGPNGEVEEIRVLSGHALLVQAAIEAVRQWRYAPTYLNDQPVSVLLQIKVHFHLTQ